MELPQLPVLCLLLCLGSSTAAFRCPSQGPFEPHPQAAFCSADFVLKATVKAALNASANASALFAISVRTEFRIPQSLLDKPSEELDRLRVPGEQAALLRPGQKYLLSGRLEEGELVSDLCQDWATPWDQVDHRRKAQLRRGRLEEACTCLTGPYGTEKPFCGRSPPRATAVVALDEWRCFTEHALCVPSPKDAQACRWTNGQPLKLCRAAIP